MKLNNLMKELLSNPEKVSKLNAKRLNQLERIKLSRLKVKFIQDMLYQATLKHERKVKTFQLLDQMKAEFVFAQREAEAAAAKAIKKPSTRKSKTAKQTLADIMTCLKSLPEEQRLKVIKAMEQKQNDKFGDLPEGE